MTLVSPIAKTHHTVIEREHCYNLSNNMLQKDFMCYH